MSMTAGRYFPIISYYSYYSSKNDLSENCYILNVSTACVGVSHTLLSEPKVQKCVTRLGLFRQLPTVCCSSVVLVGNRVPHRLLCRVPNGQRHHDFILVCVLFFGFKAKLEIADGCQKNQMGNPNVGFDGNGHPILSPFPFISYNLGDDARCCVLFTFTSEETEIEYSALIGQSTPILKY